MKAFDVRDLGLMHCDNVIKCFCEITLELAECLLVYCETLTVMCMCVFGVSFPPERHVLIFGC